MDTVVQLFLILFEGLLFLLFLSFIMWIFTKIFLKWDTWFCNNFHKKHHEKQNDNSYECEKCHRLLRIKP